MRKLARYLKPYIFPIILAVVLLFGQAQCDLKLPDYMSKIVNIGIQQGGIEHAAPEVISSEGMRLMQRFMTDAQREAVNAAYRETPAGSADRSVLKKWPESAQKDVFVKEDCSEEQQAQLDAVFGESVWTMIGTMRALAGQAGGASADMQTELTDMDVTQMYQMQPMLEALPQQTIEAARADAQAMEDSIKSQSGSVMTKAFYQELGADLGDFQQNYIMRIGAMMLLIALAGGIATILVGLLAARIAAGVARDLRRDVFGKVESFSNAEFDRFSTASLITRTTNDITQLQMLLTISIRMLFYAPIIGIGGTVMALEKSTSMSWIIALACIVLIGVILVVFSIAMPRFKLLQKLIDKLNLVARENLSGLMVVRAFGTEQFETERFDEVNTELTRTHRFINRVMVFMMPMMMLIMNGVTLLIVWFGAHQIAEATMQVGDMMAFMQYAMQIIMAFLTIAMMFIMVPRAAVSGDRIAEVLAVEPEIVDPPVPESGIADRRGYVEFRDVCFRYHGADEDALSHVSFTARPGETTAFIGATGSGKTTLVSLIPRFYDVTGGEVLLDGVDVRKLPQKELRDRIGYVPQKGILLSGTIASNLRYGRKDATDEELETAAEVAQASEFIQATEDGFDREIAQGGSNVSGGQKQRLSIARALVKRPEVYIFDDSFSALDFKTDAALRKALGEYTGESTVLIVAQRVSTIMNADQIVVLDEGKVVGVGKHRELLHTCPAYYEIASSQLSKEELA